MLGNIHLSFDESACLGYTINYTAKDDLYQIQAIAAQ